MSAANALSTNPAAPDAAEPRSVEPSMEDILASIRRIIADDQSRGLVGSAPARRGVALNVTPPVSPRSELPAASPSPEAAAPAAPGPAAARAGSASLSLPLSPSTAEALTRAARPFAALAPRPGVSRGVEPSVPHLNPLPVVSEKTAAPAPADHSAVISEIARAGASAILTPREPASIDPAAPRLAVPMHLKEPPPAFVVETVEIPYLPDEPETADAPAVAAVPEAEAQADVEPETDVLVLAGYEATPMEPAAAQETDPLLADHVGASVESSFQALATSVFMRNTGAVDSMLRDMLRPLLKTWLDDNLPTIVERLVRSEIERVARGGRP